MNHPLFDEQLNDFQSPFQARYPADFKPVVYQNSLSSSLHSLYLFFHRQLGLHILVAQNNPNRFTPKEGEVGHARLRQLGGKRVQFKTADQHVINGMHFIGKECSEDSPTLILFSGNGLRYEEYGSQTFTAVRLFTVKNWLKIGVNVLIFNYRGIEAHRGCATKNGLVLDGDAAIQYVKDQLKVPENKIILHGHSLGGGIASEVALRHPTVNYCNDRSFSSLSQQVKMMFGGGVMGTLASKFLIHLGWEFDTHKNWEKIKGHKWIVYHPKDPVIIEKARLIDTIGKISSQVPVIKMLSQWIPSKKGLRTEDLSLLESPTKGDISLAGASTHMRKLRGKEEKALYEQQIMKVLQ